MELKYIVVYGIDRDTGSTHELPYIFPKALIHSEVFESVKWNRSIMHGHVVSAGFCSVDGDKFTCYGKSESLNISSRGGEDEELLARCEHERSTVIVK